jgi:nucleotide-binding universal stress UspA family protein
MFSKILVPLDGSELAERALPVAVALAEALGGKVRLARIVPYFAVLAADPMLYEEINRMSEEEALAYLRNVASRLPEGLVVSTTAEIGSAAEGILEEARQSKARLIVMSSHGRSGIGRWMYGSVAERVLGQSAVPVLIINARCTPWVQAGRKILVPLDGSQLAEQALPPAAAVAEALGAELHLLRIVTQDHASLETDAMTEVFEDLASKEILTAREYLQDKEASLALLAVTSAVLNADDGVADTILTYAADQAIDMIVMSTHGRSGLRRWVYGSVAEKVLRSAGCATMIVREPVS